jgi:hypothetical protein
MQLEAASWEMTRVGAMRRNLPSNCDETEGAPSGSLRRASAQVPRCATDPAPQGEPTDPLASRGPVLAHSEWPSAGELESALLAADPFECSGGPQSLTGEIAELFGELEAHLPRDTVPSPPPSLDERLWLELPRDQRVP